MKHLQRDLPILDWLTQCDARTFGAGHAASIPAKRTGENLMGGAA